MAFQLNFTPFTVQQLFPSDQHPETDIKKVKAVEITNIKIKNIYDQCQEAIIEAARAHDVNAVNELAAVAHGYDIEAAKAYASSHNARLSRRVKRREVDQILCDMSQKGMPAASLQRVAQIYGFSFQQTRVPGGIRIVLKRLSLE